VINFVIGSAHYIECYSISIHFEERQLCIPYCIELREKKCISMQRGSTEDIYNIAN